MPGAQVVREFPDFGRGSAADALHAVEMPFHQSLDAPRPLLQYMRPEDFVQLTRRSERAGTAVFTGQHRPSEGRVFMKTPICAEACVSIDKEAVRLQSLRSSAYFVGAIGMACAGSSRLKKINDDFERKHPALRTRPGESKSREADNFCGYMLVTDEWDVVLRDVVSGTHEAVLQPVEILQVVHAVASAITDIETTGYVHGDLAPKNVMLKLDETTRRIKRVALVDLGLAKPLRQEAIPAAQVFEYFHFPSDRRIGPGYDLWALRVMIYELVLRVNLDQPRVKDVLAAARLPAATVHQLSRSPGHANDPSWKDALDRELHGRLVAETRTNPIFHGVVGQVLRRIVDGIRTCRPHSVPQPFTSSEVSSIASYCLQGIREREQ